MVDGSTLEALRQPAAVLRACTGRVLAGRMMVMVEAVSHQPLWQVYTENAAANDRRVAVETLVALPSSGLLVFVLGFCRCLWCDALTVPQQSFVTRLRAKTTSRIIRELSHGPYSRDEIAQVGRYRSTRVSTRCGWSRSRWLFYAFLLTICPQSVQGLGEPLERISVEIVLRACDHYRRAVQRGECDDLVTFLTEHATLRGIVKRWPMQHREPRTRKSISWDDP